MTNDLTFITNENGKNLKDRFTKLIKDTRFFDVLVGYFYTSGFYAIYPQLEKTDNREIVENSPIDDFWGIGPEGNGENQLGKPWMKIRDKS